MKQFKLVTQLIILSGMIIFPACVDEGLKPVSGVEGEILFMDTWPDSVKGVFLVALDEGAATDSDNPEDHIITFSGAIQSGAEKSSYFIQLEPGAYYMGLLGIQTDPAFFITKLDSFLDSENIPIFQITDPFEGIIISGSQTIREKNWIITFNGDTH